VEKSSQESFRDWGIRQALGVYPLQCGFCGVEAKTMTTLPHSEVPPTQGLVRPRYAFS